MCSVAQAKAAPGWCCGGRLPVALLLARPACQQPAQAAGGGAGGCPPRGAILHAVKRSFARTRCKCTAALARSACSPGAAGAAGHCAATSCRHPAPRPQCPRSACWPRSAPWHASAGGCLPCRLQPPQVRAAAERPELGMHVSAACMRARPTMRARQPRSCVGPAKAFSPARGAEPYDGMRRRGDAADMLRSWPRLLAAGA